MENMRGEFLPKRRQMMRTMLIASSVVVLLGTNTLLHSAPLPFSPDGTPAEEEEGNVGGDMQPPEEEYDALMLSPGEEQGRDGETLIQPPEEEQNGSGETLVQPPKEEQGEGQKP
jgi:hypothetical protein